MRYPYIIAEAGSCHEGQLARATRLVNLAKSCDADAVKFQYWSSASHMRARRRIENDTAYNSGSIDVTWFPYLQNRAHEVGLDFMCTAYLPEDVEEVAKWVDAFKVSSFESTDEDFIHVHGKYDKPLFISIGMWGGEGWVFPERARVLHCISAYPCPLEEANLRGVLRADGYSDHTGHFVTGAFAVAAGARYVEVHFRLDDTKPTCPDYPVALSPADLGDYIKGCRLAAVMRGTGEWKVQPSEEVNVKHRVVST